MATRPKSPPARSPEPWMRGTHEELDLVRRGAIHALELAAEDAHRWCLSLGDEEWHARPFGIPSIAFHLRHIARSLDRLLSYAEDVTMTAELSEEQRGALATEHEAGGSGASVLQEFDLGLERALARIHALSPETLSHPRGIGRLRLPTTVGGLLVHCADHTQRHSGQMVTTVQVVLGIRPKY